MATVNLENCGECGQRARIIRSVKVKDLYRRRRHECQTCRLASGKPKRWNSWESRINPIRHIRMLEAGRRSKVEPLGQPKDGLVSQAPSSPRNRVRRVASSKYLGG